VFPDDSYLLFMVNAAELKPTTIPDHTITSCWSFIVPGQEPKTTVQKVAQEMWRHLQVCITNAITTWAKEESKCYEQHILNFL
jgi:hypothetical protein